MPMFNPYQAKLRSAQRMKECECSITIPVTDVEDLEGMELYKNLTVIASDGQEILVHRLPFICLSTN